MKLIKPIIAQITNPTLNSQNISEKPEGYVNSTIQTVIDMFFIVGTIYFVWHIVFSAYHLIASNGDPKKYEESLRSIVNALVGILIIFSIFGILKLVGTVFGISGLESLSIKWPTIGG
jgi:hypothetical protein